MLFRADGRLSTLSCRPRFPNADSRLTAKQSLNAAFSGALRRVRCNNGLGSIA